MKIYSVLDAEFAPYGRVFEDKYPDIVKTLSESTPLPDGVEYVASCEALERLPVAKEISERIYGGMPVQLGYCNGHNTKLNCLEYHRDSEFNLGSEDFILLIARQDEIGADGILDTSKVKAFMVPAGVLVEVYATTLHYAPCSAKAGHGFKVLVVLPKGTNTERPDFKSVTREDTLLTARNKWLLAHPDSDEAKSGAVIGLKGENIDIADII